MSLKSYVEYLQGRFITSLLRGDAHPITSGMELELDGRKQTRVLRELVEQEYLQDTGRSDGRLHITLKAYHEVEATRPDIVARVFGDFQPYDLTDLKRRLGLPYKDLSLGERKWVVEHPADYEVFSYNQNWAPETAEFARIGDAKCWENHMGYDKTLYVRDHETRERHVQRIAEFKFQEVRKRNLAWGLVHLGLVPQVYKDHFQHADHSWPHDAPAFGMNPATWKADFERIQGELARSIDAAHTRLRVLEDAAKMVEAMGGWDIFLEKYDAALKTELASKESHVP